MLKWFVLVSTLWGAAGIAFSSPPSALIIGAAGFIGSHLTMHIAKAGNISIVAADNLYFSNSAVLKRDRAAVIKNTAGVAVLHHEYCSSASIRELLTREYSYIFNFPTDRDESSVQDRGTCFYKLLDEIRVQKSANKTSPVIIYGSNIDNQLNENIAKSFAAENGIMSTGIRHSNLYGPLCREDVLVSKLVQAIVDEEPIDLAAKGPNTIELTYIDDIVDGIVHLMACGQVNESLVYSLNDNTLMPLRNIVSTLGTLLEKVPITRTVDNLKSYSDSDERSLSERSIDIAGRTSIKEGLAQHVEWYKSYQRSIMPCVSECSQPNMCFESGWQKSAAVSRALTVNCTIVFYSVATSPVTSELYPAPVANVGCNIVFIASNAVLVKRTRTLRYRNWNLVSVDVDFHGFEDKRKPSRVPKLSPGGFFAPNVSYAIYGDSSIQLLKPIKDVYRLMTARPISNDSAVFAAIRHPSLKTTSIFEEFRNVLRMRRTHFPEALLYQEKVYRSYMRTYAGLKLDVLFDGSLLAYDLRSHGSKKFRCSWFSEYMHWSDRDQLSGALILNLLNFHAHKSTSNNSEWFDLGAYSVAGEIVREYAHVVPRPFHPQSYRRTQKCPSCFYSKKEIKKLNGK